MFVLKNKNLTNYDTRQIIQYFYISSAASVVCRKYILLFIKYTMWDFQSLLLIFANVAVVFFELENWTNWLIKENTQKS